VKKIVLAALLAVAYQAAFADDAVVYDVTFSRDNTVLKQETLKTHVGTPVVSTLTVSRPGTTCTLKDASGAAQTVSFPLDDESVLTAVPSALKDGRIETVISARIVRAAAKDAVKSGDCTVVPGQTRSIQIVDFVPMHETDTRTYNMGDGTVIVLKLTKGGAPSAQ
jgi:hypothetical protein